MKKNFETSSFVSLRKLLLMMKLIFILIFSSFLAVSANSYSQATRLSLDLEKATVKEVFDAIEKQSEYIFFYQDQVIDLDRQVTVELKDKKIDEVLDQLFEGTGNVYRVNDRQVIISYDESKMKLQEKKSETIKTETEQPQKKTIIGKVTDTKGEPLPGASIVVKGTTVGVTTDFDGNYSLEIPDDAEILVFSFVGMITTEVAIGDQLEVNIVLEEDAIGIEEVVAVGYGTQSKARVTSAISQIKSSQLEKLPASSIDQALAGQAAGVHVVQTSGAPGKDNQINIRGVATITAGTNPLIVLDGLPLSENTSLSSINPSDIATMDILKDAAAAAIYGSRGNNGVIIITTKKGDTSKTKFSFDAYYGVQQVAKTIEMMDAYEWAAWSKEARDNYYISLDPSNHSANDPNDVRQANASALGGNTKKVIIPEFAKPYLAGQQGLTNTDWQDAIFRNAPIQNYQLSASGGTEKTNYFVSGNYFSQEGIVVGSDFQRYSMRLNLETELSKKVRFGVNLSPSFSNQNTVPEGWDDTPVLMAINSIPIFSPYNEDGSLAISQQARAALEPDIAIVENPLAFETHIKNENKFAKIVGSSFIEYSLAQGLKAKFLGGVDYNNMRHDYYRPGFLGAYRSPAPTIASGNSSSSSTMNWVSELTLSYVKNIDNKHFIDAVAGYTFQKERYDYSMLTATNFPNDQVETLSAGTVTDGTTIAEEWSLISYLARVNYHYQNKYMVSLAFRRDGSSRFGKDSKWGNFPSASLGWRVSEETFFPKNDVLSDFKVRASWGITGNNLIGNYASQALLGQANAILGGTLQNGLYPRTSPNTGLSWEEKDSKDIGLDFGFFKNKLSLHVDYYNATSKNILLNVPVPAHSGYTSSLQNLGSVRNQGIEADLVANYNIGQVKVNSTFNISSNKNTVLELGPGQEQLITGRHITEVGGPLGAHYGYKTNGIFTSQEQLDSYPHLSTATIGDYIYVDTNNDKKINSDDRTVLGTFWPDYTYAFSSTFDYKNFDFSFMLQGVQGVMVHDRLLSVLLYNPESWNNGSKDYWDNHYSAANAANAKYARANTQPKDNGYYRESDVLHDDASYVRFRNITLGYTLPESLIQKVGINNARIYFTSKNPFAFSKFRGYNPEQTSNDPLQPGLTFGNYPTERSFVFGFNITF